MNLEDQIKRDEGNIAYAYDDADGKAVSPNKPLKGYITVGVGINIDKRGGGLLPEEIDFLLKNRIRLAREELIRAQPWIERLDPVRQAVLINMTFNMGLARLSGFVNTLKAAARSDWEATAAHMLDSLWAVQVGPRATRLAEQMRTGEWR